MSQKSQPRCVVVVEPISKVLMEKMEAIAKEPSKKKAAKSVEEKTVAAEVKEAVAASSNSSHDHKEPEAQPQENGTSSQLNGKDSHKKEKKSKRDKSPAADKAAAVTNGVSDVALSSTVVNSTEASVPTENATEPNNAEPMEDDVAASNADADNDELFPELNYDETSDNECNFDSSSPDFSPVGRSVTRRSQAKNIPTPETPQLQVPCDTPEVGESTPQRNTPDRNTPSKEKIFKMKDMYIPAPPSPRRTRATESPLGDKDDSNDSKNGSGTMSGDGGKSETNYAKSRIKVSPYRRSTRISEQFSTIANYSGNNSTQQTELAGDISSSSRDKSPASGDTDHSGDYSNGDRSYTDSFRQMKGRRSYKHLRELSLRNLSAQRRQHGLSDSTDKAKDISISSVNATVGSQSNDNVSEPPSGKWTPVGHVVGRKRRQEEEESPMSSVQHLTPHAPSPALLLGESIGSEPTLEQQPSKRARLLGYVATPLRQLRDKMASSTPIVQRHTQIGARQALKADPLLIPSSGDDVTMAEEQSEMPQVADIVPAGAANHHEGHKWCAIM